MCVNKQKTLACFEAAHFHFRVQGLYIEPATGRNTYILYSINIYTVNIYFQLNALTSCCHEDALDIGREGKEEADRQTEGRRDHHR